ncbi:DNA polymerase alpha catalytic subunit-like [Chenopodium quinoa]|uniref:DNA polymerase alpha catalytic subunit-like n=1 Tax=Chenopodium quinoa TaxID=63459 RepID=UPI000B7903C8|nr:DNA polymerase alpha catalytic subunit-like [Chenopodium quinoa]
MRVNLVIPTPPSPELLPLNETVKQIINDLLNPTGQNLRVREDAQVSERKGLDMVRCDWSLLSKEVGDYCLSPILSRGCREDVVESIHSYLMKLIERPKFLLASV